MNVKKNIGQWKLFYYRTFFQALEQTNVGLHFNSTSHLLFVTFLFNVSFYYLFGFLVEPRKMFLRWYLSFALSIPTAHNFCVTCASTWARTRTKHKIYINKRVSTIANTFIPVAWSSGFSTRYVKWRRVTTKGIAQHKMIGIRYCLTAITTG